MIVVEDAALRQAYQRLLVPSFPASELMGLPELAGMVAAGTASVHAAGERDDPIAVAVVQRLQHSRAVLLPYFAARPDRRGRGVGTRLLSELLAGIRADPSVTVVLGEVEHPRFHPPHPEHGDPVARLRFYGRLGGQILAVPYFQPPIDAGQEPVYAMLLLALDPPPELVRDGRLLPAAGLEPALQAMMSGADPARFPVDALLDAARDPRGVQLLGVGALEDAPVSRPL